MSFTNPNSHSGGQAAFSKNDVHAEDSVVTIGWTGVTDGEFSTVFLWQMNVTKAATDTDTNDAVMGGGEYVTRGESSNITSFPWTVATSKDLTESNMFMMSLYQTGVTSPDDYSVNFNISSRSSNSGGSTSTTSIAATTSSPTSGTTSASSPTGGTTSTSLSSQGGLDTGAKVGIGVGIPAAVIIGIAAGWFIFRKRKSPRSSWNDPPGPVENKRASHLPPHASGTQDQYNLGGQKTYFEASGESRNSAAPFELGGC